MHSSHEKSIKHYGNLKSSHEIDVSRLIKNSVSFARNDKCGNINEYLYLGSSSSLSAIKV